MDTPQSLQATDGVEATPWSSAGDRWLAPDAKPASNTVLAVLHHEGTMTIDDIVEATGYTAPSVERILDELTSSGIVRSYRRSDRPPRFRLR